MALPDISGEFRLGNDPELRITPTGKVVTTARAVASKRRKNEETHEWEDDRSIWLTLEVWGQAGEHFAESAVKGSLVIVRGQLYMETWTDNNGNERQTPKVNCWNIGPSWQTSPTKQGTVDRGAPATEAAVQRSKSTMDVDPWATPASDEPPF